MKQYFVTRLDSDGAYSPRSLPQYLGSYVVDLEQRFGPRDSSFTILGIELVDSPTEEPHLWFPNTDPAGKHIVVHLSPQPLDNARIARWQLAHECLHLLDPCLPPTNVLEEGLATWYQNKAVPVPFATPEPYDEPERLVYPLMDELPAAIRGLRRKGYRIGRLTAEQLQEACPHIQQDLAIKLTETFSYDGKEA